MARVSAGDRRERAAAELQALCARGQELLLATDYLGAEAALVGAEKIATDAEDFDTLGRLYLPLQEARRQRRQRCGEGIICLDLIARDADDPRVDADAIAGRIGQGQLLIAGWGSIAPAVRLREIQSGAGLYLDTFLAAVYPVRGRRAVVIAPVAETRLPAVDVGDALAAALPAGCLVVNEDELPRGEARGTYQGYAATMALWERLHAPFLAAGDAETEPLKKIFAYRLAIAVDYACELAHQRLSDAALRVARERARGEAGK